MLSYQIKPLPLKNILQHLGLLLLSFVFAYSAFPQSKDPSPLNFPTPKNQENMLFYLQRDPNINTLIYALNINKNGEVDDSKPILAYWIRYAEKGEQKELGYIQRKFAYGIDSKVLSKEKFELKFAAYKKISIYLKRGSDKHYYASVNLNNKTIKVNRIFVRIVGGTFWVPNVRYAEIEGTDELTGKFVSERINIK